MTHRRAARRVGRDVAESAAAAAGGHRPTPRLVRNSTGRRSCFHLSALTRICFLVPRPLATLAMAPDEADSVVLVVSASPLKSSSRMAREHSPLHHRPPGSRSAAEAEGVGGADGFRPPGGVRRRLRRPPGGRRTAIEDVSAWSMGGLSHSGHGATATGTGRTQCGPDRRTGRAHSAVQVSVRAVSRVRRKLGRRASRRRAASG